MKTLSRPTETKPARKTTKKTDTKKQIKTALTVALGIAIPMLSLSLSKISGQLALDQSYWLAGFAFALCVSVLAVSLSHLAWAIEDITGSEWKASWALAVTIDLALVCCELTQVWATGLETVTTILMVSVCGFSMVLNVWAFIMKAR